MGGLFSCIARGGKQPAKEHGKPERSNGIACGIPVQTLDEFNTNAKEIAEALPTLLRESATFEISSYNPPAYDSKSGIAIEKERSERFNSLPESVQQILILWRQAHKLQHFGHSGAWDAYVNRHGHIWLDSAYMLPPLAQKAILLYALQPLMIGKARKCNMTFFFTTFPNVKSDELNTTQRRTLMTLIDVFNSRTFLKAREIIDVNQAYLEGENMEAFLADLESLGPEEDTEQKHIKLLRYTRRQMQKYWHGWRVDQLTFDNLKQLYRMAVRESQKQQKLLNNNSFIYLREIGNYKRLLKKEDSYNITCTFVLATHVTPTEVEAIQDFQRQGADLVAAALKKPSLLKRGAAREADTPETQGTVAQDLQKQGHPFCIEAIVFTDDMGEQGIEGYEKIDNFLNGTRHDINDLTQVSQSTFITHLLQPDWIFKTTTSHDPRVDDWSALRAKSKFNPEPLKLGKEGIQVPSVELVLEFVFGIVEDTSDRGCSDDEFLEGLQRNANVNKPIQEFSDRGYKADARTTDIDGTKTSPNFHGSVNPTTASNSTNYADVLDGF